MQFKQKDIYLNYIDIKFNEFINDLYTNYLKWTHGTPQEIAEAEYNKIYHEFVGVRLFLRDIGASDIVKNVDNYFYKVYQNFLLVYRDTKLTPKEWKENIYNFMDTLERTSNNTIYKVIKQAKDV